MTTDLRQPGSHSRLTVSELSMHILGGHRPGLPSVSHSVPEKTPPGRWRTLVCWLLAATTAVLVACGGGDVTTAGGVGSGGTGLAEGTVTGLGSVIVDGITYTETNAAVVADNESGLPGNADLQVGQRVRLVYGQVNGADTASRIEVLPQLKGPVTAVVSAAGQLQVMGQTVQVQSSGTQSQTVLAGVASVSALAVGDVVEVHGSWQRDAATSRYQLVATRLEKIAATTSATDRIRLLSGVVHGLTSTSAGMVWHLNAANGVAVLTSSASAPAGLADGSLVRLWLTSVTLASPPLQPLRTALADLATATTTDADIRFSAQAASYNAATRTLEVQGVKLSLPSTLVLDEDALEKGGYVTVNLSRKSGQLQVVSASAQSGGTALTREIELKGVISGVDFSASPVVFALRGTTVQAAPAVLDAECLLAGTGDVYLQVQGRLPAGSTALLASRVQCKAQAPNADAVVERQGTVISVNTALRSLVLQLGTGAKVTTLTAVWDTNSYFQQSPDKLPGLTVEIEGVQNGSQLRIRRVRLITGAKSASDD